MQGISTDFAKFMSRVWRLLRLSAQRPRALGHNATFCSVGTGACGCGTGVHCSRRVGATGLGIRRTSEKAHGSRKKVHVCQGATEFADEALSSAACRMAWVLLSAGMGPPPERVCLRPERRYRQIRVSSGRSKTWTSRGWRRLRSISCASGRLLCQVRCPSKCLCQQAPAIVSRRATWPGCTPIRQAFVRRCRRRTGRV
jgi:hypothetical protein